MLLHAIQVANPDPDPDPDLLFPRDLAQACAYYCRYPVIIETTLRKADHYGRPFLYFYLLKSKPHSIMTN